MNLIQELYSLPELTLRKKMAKRKADFKSTTPEESNDLGNGWTDGAKDFKQFWQETDDADFEIVQPKQIEEKLKSKP